MTIDEQRDQAIFERNQRVKNKARTFFRYKTKFAKFFKVIVEIECPSEYLQNIETILKRIITQAELSDNLPEKKADAVTCNLINQYLFFNIAAVFADTNIKITVLENSGSGVTVHYDHTKPHQLVIV